MDVLVPGGIKLLVKSSNFFVRGAPYHESGSRRLVYVERRSRRRTPACGERPCQSEAKILPNQTTNTREMLRQILVTHIPADCAGVRMLVQELFEQLHGARHDANVRVEDENI